MQYAHSGWFLLCTTTHKGTTFPRVTSIIPRLPLSALQDSPSSLHSELSRLWFRAPLKTPSLGLWSLPKICSLTLPDFHFGKLWQTLRSGIRLRTIYSPTRVTLIEFRFKPTDNDLGIRQRASVFLLVTIGASCLKHTRLLFHTDVAIDCDAVHTKWDLPMLYKERHGCWWRHQRSEVLPMLYKERHGFWWRHQGFEDTKTSYYRRRTNHSLKANYSFPANSHWSPQLNTCLFQLFQRRSNKWCS